MYSQLRQDDIVFSLLNQQKNGTYVDVGSGDWRDANNTLFLEEHGWTGINVDFDKRFQDGWEEHRPESKVYFEDAITFDYKKVFKENNMPSVIDYLSIDLEPPMKTWEAFLALPHDEYKFRVITFEHDAHRQNEMLNGSSILQENHLEKTREKITSLGYTLLHCLGMQDDVYILGENNGEQ